MNSRNALLGLALLGAGALAFFGDRRPDTDLAEAVTPSSPSAALRDGEAPSSHSSRKNKDSHDPFILALQPRDVLMDRADPAAESRKLFDVHSWAPPPPPPPKPAPPPPPMAPPLPYTYLGKKVEDGQWEAYLAKGSQTFIVQEQSILDENYRVDAIRPPTLHLTYLPLNQAQTLNIGGFD